MRWDIPGASQGLIPYILLVLGALGSFIAAAGLIYWAIHNSAKGVREELREGFRRLEDLLMSHQHDAQGYPYATSRPRDND